MSTKKIQPFYDEGRKAFLDRVSMAECPYIGSESVDGWQWQFGYLDAMMDMVHRLRGHAAIRGGPV